jgi:hypothetical protein
LRGAAWSARFVGCAFCAPFETVAMGNGAQNARPTLATGFTLTQVNENLRILCMLSFGEASDL